MINRSRQKGIIGADLGIAVIGAGRMGSQSFGYRPLSRPNHRREGECRFFLGG
jgi:hypothetical protein